MDPPSLISEDVKHLHSARVFDAAAFRGGRSSNRPR